MDKYDTWKKTEDMEIDLADLLHRLCRQWKRIAACALASAVLLGGYGWMKGREGTDTEQSVPEEETLTEAEEQTVMSAVQLEYEIRGLETYLENSILMQLDPYHKSRFIMLYGIDHVQGKELPAIMESYLNFILNGGAADELKKTGAWEIDKSYLAELVSAYQKTYSFPYQVMVDGQTDSGGTPDIDYFFYVEITGKDAKAAEKLALDMQAVLDRYSGTVRQTAGKHRLALLDSTENTTADSGLQSLQHDKRVLLLSDKANLRTITEAFSEQQMALYEKALKMEDAQDAFRQAVSDGTASDAAAPDQTASTETESGKTIADEKTLDRPVLRDNLRTGMKYLFLGFAGGVAAYCGIYLCWYFFRDTVKSAEEIKRLYRFPFYGEIPLNTSKARRDSYENSVAQVLNRIRLACKKQGLDRLCAVSDLALDAEERECLESMAGKLREWEIDLCTVENARTDTGAWDRLSQIGNVLLVCRVNATTHRMIDDAMSFYVENGISVAGAAVFSHDV